MFMAGMEFVVLSPGFLVHDGFKGGDGQNTFYLRRNEETSRNRKKFPEFVKELVEKYGHDNYGMMEKVNKQPNL